MSKVRQPICPPWCVASHSSEEVTWHAAQPVTVAVGRASDESTNLMEVRTVQYLPEGRVEIDGSGTEWSPFLEITHHVDGRYRLINMSSDQARSFAKVLLECAHAAESLSGPSGRNFNVNTVG